MGEWPEYFEDFPAENLGHYVTGKFDPAGAKAHRVRQDKVAGDQKRLNAEIAAIVEKHKKTN